MSREKVCMVAGCGRTFTPGKDGAKGRCTMHYQRKWRVEKRGTGDPGDLNVPGELKKEPTTKITVYPKVHVGERARRLADLRQMSVSAWVEEAMDRYADREERRLQQQAG